MSTKRKPGPQNHKRADAIKLLAGSACLIPVCSVLRSDDSFDWVTAGRIAADVAIVVSERVDDVMGDPIKLKGLVEVVAQVKEGEPN